MAAETEIEDMMHQMIDFDPTMKAHGSEESTRAVTATAQGFLFDVSLASHATDGMTPAVKQVTIDRIAQRVGAGSLFGMAIQRYARLFTQKDHAELRKVVHRTLTEFRQLCPPEASEVELVAAERVALARLKTLVFDLLTLTPEAWNDPDEFFEKRQSRAARELDNAMRAYMQLRKVAESQPGFRWTVSESETTCHDGRKTTTRSVSVEQSDEIVSENAVSVPAI